MSAGLDGGGGGGGGGRGRREIFLSAHRCPEVDLPPRRNAATRLQPGPSGKNPKVTRTGQPEANYLDVLSAERSDEEEEEEEEGEGSVSDWSEEDLSLHFSPSVIHPSEDEDEEPEGGFECVDITVETQEKGQEGEGPKMVPKRQIQLKKKETENTANRERTEEAQVTPRDGHPARGGGAAVAANSEVSANEPLSHGVHQRPDLLLRQHSMPTSLHAPSATGGDADGHRVYRGLVAGASQGFQVGGNSRQRLQKSFSLDETKAKMASCIIKNVLSKKMQAEQSSSKRSYPQRKSAAMPGPPGGGAKTGGALKGPAHVVRDLRSVVKSSYGVSFPAAPTATPENGKTKSIKASGQDASPPPTYQQAVGVRGHDEASRGSQATAQGSAAGVATPLGQSQLSNNRGHRFGRPVAQQQRRGGEPMTNKGKAEEVGKEVDPSASLPVAADPSELNQSERDGGVSQQDGTSLPAPRCAQTPPRPPSKPAQCKETQPPPTPAEPEQRSIPGGASHLGPGSAQPIFHPCFYAPTALPAFPAALRPHAGKVSYVHAPLSYAQARLQRVQSVPTLHLLRRSDESHGGPTANAADQRDMCVVKTCPPLQAGTTGGQGGGSGDAGRPGTQEQKEHQQKKVQAFLPAQVGGDRLVDATGSTATPSGDAACYHIMLDPTNGWCFYVDQPPQPQRKMLLDPETGQYVQVFLPASGSAPNGAALPVNFAHAAPFGPSVMNPAPAFLSVMQFRPAVAVSSLYGAPCLPFTLHTPSVNVTHTAL